MESSPDDPHDRRPLPSARRSGRRRKKKTAGREVGIAGQILRHAIPRTSLITAVLSSPLFFLSRGRREKRELITGPGGQRILLTSL